MRPSLEPATPPSAQPGGIPTWAKVAAGLVVSALLLWLAARQVDFPLLVADLSEANYVYIGLAVAAYFVDVAFRAVRWQVLLSTVGSISARRLYPVLAIGYMANNLPPGELAARTGPTSSDAGRMSARRPFSRRSPSSGSSTG